MSQPFSPIGSPPWEDSGEAEDILASLPSPDSLGPPDPFAQPSPDKAITQQDEQLCFVSDYTFRHLLFHSPCYRLCNIICMIGSSLIQCIDFCDFRVFFREPHSCFPRARDLFSVNANCYGTVTAPLHFGHDLNFLTHLKCCFFFIFGTLGQLLRHCYGAFPVSRK